jgi:1-acyl-sn-glycerol-3-phosphate acyltransferase
MLIWTSKKAARRFPYLYHRAVTKLLGIQLRVSGKPVADQGCLVAVNHVSWLDIPILSAVTPLSFIAKREVASWPFFGTLARLQRSVFIDRERRQRAAASRTEMMTRLAERDTLVLFAEGTSSDGIRVLPFKSAFFAAAELLGSRKALARHAEDTVRRGLRDALAGRNRAAGSRAAGNAIGERQPQALPEPV